MPASDALSHVFRAAAALDTIGSFLVELGDDLPPTSSTELGHLLLLLENDLTASCTKLLEPN